MNHMSCLKANLNKFHKTEISDHIGIKLKTNQKTRKFSSVWKKYYYNIKYSSKEPQLKIFKMMKI